MKPATLLLLASLFANVALVALVATRPASHATAPVPAVAAASDAATGQSAGRDAAMRAAIASGNAAALEAAGLDRTLAREIALGRTVARLAARAQTEKTGAGDARWWRNSGNQPAQREQQLSWRREMTDALTAAGLDPTFFLGAGDTNQLAFLPAEKREALRRITQDYDEMMAKFSAGGVQLASDRERLKLLRAEKERDIAALLTPEERLAYEQRTSPSAAMVRARYGDGIETEEDFRKIHALQKAFDEKFPADALTGRIAPETFRARSEAQRQLQDDIRAALGETGYARLRRASDSDLRTVDSLVTRLNLPANTTDRVAAVRETLAAESQRINADAAVPLTQRRAQIQELGTRAKNEVQQMLGAEAADAYTQRSSWIGMLQNGLAYSTTPQANTPGAMLAGTQSVFPVMPAGTGTPGTTRQMIFSGPGGVVTDAPVVHGGMMIDRPAAGIRENVQVMTFSASTTDAAAPGAAGGVPVERTIIVAPPPASPSTPPSPPR